MALSHTDDLQRLRYREERVGGEIKLSGNTGDGSPSIQRSHLQSVFSLLLSFQKHLDVQASRPKEGVEAFKDGFMKTNISSYSNYENYFQLHERNDLRGFCKLNAIPIKKLEKQRHKLSNSSAHNTTIKRQKL